MPRFVTIPPVLRFVAPGTGPVVQPFVVFVLHTVLKHPYWRQPGGAHCRLGRLIRDSILALGDGPTWELPEQAHAALVECVGLLDLDAAAAPFLLDQCDPILNAGREPPAPPPEPPAEEPPGAPAEPAKPAPEAAQATPPAEASGG